MTTLVTGATGFVGSHVARLLVNQGHAVRIFSRPTSKKTSNADVLADLPVERAEGDLRDAASIERAMRGVRRVFHVAADYRLWSAHPEEIYESNVEGTRKLRTRRTVPELSELFTRALLQRSRFHARTVCQTKRPDPSLAK